MHITLVHNEWCLLLTVAQSIRDLQTLLAFFVCDSAVMGPPARVENVVVIHALPNLKFGDNMTKHTDWELFVEVSLHLSRHAGAWNDNFFFWPFTF